MVYARALRALVARLEYLTIIDHWLAPDVVIETPLGQRLDGVEAVRREQAKRFRVMPPLSAQTEALFVDETGEGFAAISLGRCRLAQTGRTLADRSLVVYTVRDRLVVRIRHYLQSAAVIDDRSGRVIEQGEGTAALAIVKRMVQEQGG